jgi:hypothetical protein
MNLIGDSETKSLIEHQWSNSDIKKEIHHQGKVSPEHRGSRRKRMRMRDQHVAPHLPTSSETHYLLALFPANIIVSWSATLVFWPIYVRLIVSFAVERRLQVDGRAKVADPRRHGLASHVECKVRVVRVRKRYAHHDQSNTPTFGLARMIDVLRHRATTHCGPT